MPVKRLQDWRSLLNDFLETAKRPLVVILGPTASGKTAFSIFVAQEIARKDRLAEIINADSRQLYVGLDIGTAKITFDERQGIAHHLLDVLDPKKEATAAWYQGEASRVIDQILQRNAIPLLVGGSMLYISAIIDGLTFATAADPALRARLEEQYDRDDGQSLFIRLQELDPDTARVIDRRNKPYVLRAVEICESTGKPASLQKQQSDVPYELLILGTTLPREMLHQRINDRVKQMFAAGWREEVERLLAQGAQPDFPGLISHGYREIIVSLEGDMDDDTVVAELIAARTRQYAKRQLTWWRRDPRIHWFRGDTLDAVVAADL